MGTKQEFDRLKQFSAKILMGFPSLLTLLTMTLQKLFVLLRTKRSNSKVLQVERELLNGLPPRLKGMVRHLYSGALASAGTAGGFFGALYSVIYYPKHRSVWTRAVSHLSDGIRAASQKISSLSNQVVESEMVVHWKDFIQGLPEYSILVRAKKFKEIENILTTLARQNEIFRVHEERIREIQKAIKELQDEAGKA